MQHLQLIMGMVDDDIREGHTWTDEEVQAAENLLREMRRMFAEQNRGHPKCQIWCPSVSWKTLLAMLS